MTDSVTERLNAAAADLRRSVKGEVRFDLTSRLLYATDASIYQIMPLGVVIPRDADDVVATVEVAARYELPVLPRGAGTSLAGQAVGAAVVVDCSKYMNRLLDVDPEARTCRVEPGHVLAELNRRLAPLGLMFGPDPASADRATVGGVLGNNATGAHSILYGMAADNVEAVHAVLADGSICTFSPLDEEALQARLRLETAEGRLYRALCNLADRYAPAIERDFPRHWRRASGYNLDRLLAGRRRGCLNLAEVLVGSEGTLAFVTEATLKLVPRPPHRGLGVVEFGDLIRALEAVMPILETEPAAIELLDHYLLSLTRAQPGYAPLLTWVRGDPEAILFVEFFGESEAEVRHKLDRLEARLARWGYQDAPILKLLDPKAQQRAWSVRKAGLGLLLSMKGDWKPVTFVEDTSVPPEHLPEFIRRFRQVVRDHGTDAAFYAHASAGCLHCRPILNLKTAEGVRQMRQIAEAVVELVLAFGGVLSGEHGDGLSRSEFNRRLFGPELYRAMQEFKAAWDPHNRFNPGKIVNAPPMDQNLRYGPDYRAVEPSTAFAFRDMQGFARAVEQCNGMGVCRRLHGGVMCPSFRATLEETDSTRGRANMLRAAISGRLPDGLASSEVYRVLDLCLACKACKHECPSQVDMARLKSEFLYHYARTHRRPLRDYLFAYLPALYRLAAPFAPLVNGILGAPVVPHLLGRLGIAPNRRLPRLHRRTFRHWFERHTPHPRAGERGTVVLFADTFTTYNEPQVGAAAVRVLEACGWTVRLAPPVCCGRPFISKGFLDQARDRAKQVVETLAPFAEAGFPVVGLEPSCLLTLRDEVLDLLPGNAQAEAVARHAFLLGEFLSAHAEVVKEVFRPRSRLVLYHAHCHEKALAGSQAALNALALVPDQRVELIETTCCGMAGSFGYEAEHDRISRQIAQLGLVPTVETAPADAVIAVSGFSCRQQVAALTGRRPYHLAEVLAEALNQGFSAL